MIKCEFCWGKKLCPFDINICEVGKHKLVLDDFKKYLNGKYDEQEFSIHHIKELVEHLEKERGISE